MNKRKRTNRTKRIIALVLAVAMLPFSDYGQVLALQRAEPYTHAGMMML